MTPEPDLVPYTKHVLDNGLEVLLHEDHSDPIVAVYVYYHVGSSREDATKSGFAHLFEHMLFQGSENVGDNDHFRLITEAGGTLNGTTNQDRTNYYETLPSNQLELALWLESDRMGRLLPAMTQAKLDNQRDVVMNERRQNYDNRPYGLVHETVLGLLYPEGHPYSWPTIGAMEHIAAATLEDVTAFFQRWYGPNNATVAIGGDFDPDEALALVDKYFGSLPRGPVVSNPRPQPARLDASRRALLEDDVAIPQLTLAWPTVHGGHPDEEAIDLLSDVLSANRSSILDDVLMIREELASSVTIGHHAAERAGTFTINVRPNPGVTLAQLETRVDELIDGFANGEGVGEERVARLKVRREGLIVRTLETVAGRTSRLGLDNCVAGDPARVESYLARLRKLTEDDLRDAARRYLAGRPRVAVSVVPRGKRELAADGGWTNAAVEGGRAPLDRSRRPEPGAPRPFEWPTVWRTQLSNGVRVSGTAYDKIPLSRFSIALPGGRLAESVETLGVCELTSRMLEEGSAKRSGGEFLDAIDGLGGVFQAAAHDDELSLEMSVLDEHVERAFELAAEALLTPRFAAEDFERVRRQQLVDLEARADRAAVVANEVFERVVHPGVAGAPSLGTKETLARLTLDDVRAFWRDNLVDRATRIAFVGRATDDAARALLAPLDRDWPARAATAAAERTRHAAAEHETGVRVFLVDKPGAEQSELRIGHAGFPRTEPFWFPCYAMNFVLGGSFSSRINLNLREDKGYTYGARSGFSGGATLGTFVVSSAVQSRTTGASITEVLAEVRGLLEGGVTDAEVEFARQAISQSLARAYESGNAKLALVEAIQKYGWPDDYPAERIQYLRTMRASDLTELARAHVRPDAFTILVVGDRASVEPQLAELGLGEVRVLDATGRQLEAQPS